MNHPDRIIDITNGTIGHYTIGETKDGILQRMPNESFSPIPKPTECPVNWIKASEMSPTQHSCLSKASTWQESSYSTKSSCPSGTWPNTKLHFSGKELHRVYIECWPPK